MNLTPITERRRKTYTAYFSFSKCNCNVQVGNLAGLQYWCLCHQSNQTTSIDFWQSIAMIPVSVFILKWKTLQVKIGFCGNLNIYKEMSTGRIWGLCVWIWVFMRREGVGYLQNRWETNPALFRLLLLPLVKILTRIHICLMIQDTRVFWFLALLQDHPSHSRINWGNSQQLGFLSKRQN